MKNQIKLRPVMVLYVGIIIAFYLFPFAYVNGAKFQSGVTITAPSGTPTPPPEGSCQDANGDGINDVTGSPCQAASAPPAGTCGLQLVSGVPINYGQLTPGQTSAEQRVTIKNEGTSQTPAKVMIKGGNWVSDAAVASAPAGTAGAGSTISGPEVTRVAISQVDFNNKKPLSLDGWELGQLTGGQSIPVYFQLLTWVNAPSGSFHQEVTIDLLC